MRFKSICLLAKPKKKKKVVPTGDFMQIVFQLDLASKNNGISSVILWVPQSKVNATRDLVSGSVLDSQISCKEIRKGDILLIRI